jgi:hypothetical protein
MRGITGEFVDKAKLELAFVEVCKVAGEGSVIGKLRN